RSAGGKFLEWYGRNLDVNVDTIEQRTRDLPHIFFHLRRRAMTRTPRVAAIPARAGVQGGNEHEIRGERGAGESAGDRHRAVFEGLAHDFERAAIELRQFIEKQHAVVRHADFAGGRYAAAADQSRVADRMMRRTVGTRR